MERWNELDRTARLAAIGGIVVLIGSVLPWYSWVGFGISGWSSGGMAILSILASLGAAGLLVYGRFAEPPAFGNLSAGQIAAALGGLGLVLVVIRLLTWIGRGASVGLFIGVVGAALVAYASVIEMRAMAPGGEQKTG